MVGLALFVGVAHAEDLPGAVYILSNQSPQNSVLVYGRASDGALTFSGSFLTGGNGAGTGGDPLGSQVRSCLGLNIGCFSPSMPEAMKSQCSQ